MKPGKVVFLKVHVVLLTLHVVLIRVHVQPEVPFLIMILPNNTLDEAQNALQKVINAISLKTRNIPAFFESYNSFNR